MTRDSDKMTCKEACTYLTVKEFMYLFPKIGGKDSYLTANMSLILLFTKRITYSIYKHKVHQVAYVVFRSPE